MTSILRNTTPSMLSRNKLNTATYNPEYDQLPYCGLQPRVYQAVVNSILRAKTTGMLSRTKLHTAGYNPEYIEPL